MKSSDGREFVDLMVSAISDNGGRSCINASAIVVPKYAAEIAEALARKLGPVAPLPADDENARLAGFANPKMAEFIESAIEEGLKTPGARDVTAALSERPAEGAISRARTTCGPPSCCAIPSHIRWPTANSSVPTPASSRCPSPRCSKRSARRWR